MPAAAVRGKVAGHESKGPLSVTDMVLRSPSTKPSPVAARWILSSLALSLIEVLRVMWGH